LEEPTVIPGIQFIWKQAISQFHKGNLQTQVADTLLKLSAITYLPPEQVSRGFILGQHPPHWISLS